MPFRVPKIKSVCCFSLETATKIIGCLQMMIFVVLIVIPVVFVASWRNYIRVIRAVICESLALNFGWCAVLLLCGTVKKDHVLIFPWIILHTVFSASFIYSIFVQVVYYGLMDMREDSLIAETTFFLIEVYSLMIVYNHYRELLEKRPEATS